MTKTSPRVTFGLYDLELKEDSTLACSDQQPFSKLDDLRNASASNRPYASYEPNYWLLDGSYKLLPDVSTTVHVGLMSASMSGANGAFAAPPTLVVTFSQTHDTDSLSLTFAPLSGDYASALTIAYYDAASALIRQDAYAPTSAEFTTHQAVTGFRRIVITFTHTNQAYRYLRVSSLDYGDLVVFAGTAIKSASVVEEVDQLSGELRVNTLDLTLYSADAAFSIINPSGRYATLRERQPLDVYEKVDQAQVYIGRFYLNEWESLTETLSRFSATDLIGVLDGQTCRGGMWSGIPLEDLLQALLAPIHVPYELDNQLVGTRVTGWLPVGSYRAALQQIGFAVGASVSCARSGVLRIFKSRIAATDEATLSVSRAQKGQDQSLSLKPLVTSVELTAHAYTPGGESQVLVSGLFQPGRYEVTFTEPVHALSVSGAAILDSGVNYADLLVSSPGAISLTGLKYMDTTAVTTITNPTLPAYVRPNVLKIDKATLVNAKNVAEVAGRVYAYSQQRLLQQVKLYAPAVEPGSVVVMDALYGKRLRLVVEKMESDLAMGFTSKVELTGVEYVD